MPGRKIIKSRYFFEDDFSEALAEVPVADSGGQLPQEKFKVIGKPVSRPDGYDKVSGTAQYAFDVILPHMVYAKTLRSPHPHARIKSIETGPALKHPGVLAVISHKNTQKIPWYSETSFLFDPHLRYPGDEVACLAAESAEIAQQALELIRVEYDILPFVADAKKAMEPNAPKLYETGNIVGGKPYIYKRGDAEQGFKEADAIVEETFSTQVAVHNPTEVHCSVVNWDGDHLTVWDSTQSVFTVRDALAAALNLPANKVRVIKKYMGGGFGSKLAPGKYTVMAALLARQIGRPVKITLDRKEMSLAVGNRPDSFQKLKAGAKKDGTLTAMSHYSYGAVGAYPYGAGCSWPLRTVYRCDNVMVEEYSVHINAGPGRPMRAPGHVQGTVALDAVIDELAEKIDMDPLTFRLKNYAERDQVFNIPYTSKRLREAYEKGAEAIGWQRRNQPAVSGGTGPVRRGIGMATQIWWGGGGPPAYATVKLNRDGSAHVAAGTQDLGTGTYTYIAQVVAEVLEIPLENITVTLGDTGLCPYCPGSGGSVTSPSVSPAVYDAAVQVKTKLMSAAAALLELPEDQLLYRNGVITAKADEAKKMTLTDIIGKMQEREILATGARNANPNGYMINTFGAQFAEVEVDTETGKVRVLKVVAVHDIGRLLNRKTAENQCHGGIIQGLSFALMEQRIIDQPTGQVLTTNLHDYKMPIVMDMPEIEMIIVSDADPMISSLGVKGIGEPVHIPTAAAIANAVYNAIGVRIKTLPITPDKIITGYAGHRS
jgi:xanthine dehydrogenase YagR molybdenum-binding subunit